MAPDAKIVLMEAQSTSDTDLFASVQAAGGYLSSTSVYGEISMSWGGSEFSGESTYDIFLIQPGVVYFASSGDSPGPIYPSTSPYVVSAGGTQIERNSAGDYTKQVATTTCGTGCGGGKSAYEARPSYQNPVKSVVGSARGTPDIASDASSKSPVYVYDSSCYNSWLQVWGTSVASPTLAGIINRAGSFKADTNLELTEIYNNRTNAADFTDIKSGSCGGGNSAKVGYDLCTGVGVVKPACV
jgi:subtilase family serine protease